MFKNVKNRIILLYLSFSLIIFVLYAVSLETNFFNTIKAYQENTLKMIDEIVAVNLDSVKKHLNTFLDFEYAENNIEDYYNDEIKLKKYLNEFHTNTRFSNTIFVYLEDGRTIFSKDSLTEKIYNLGEFKSKYDDVKRTGNITITDMIKIPEEEKSSAKGMTSISYIIRPLYARDGEFVGTVNMSIDNHIIGNLFKQLNISRLYGDIEIYFKGERVYFSSEKENIKTITKNLVNTEHDIKYVMKNVLNEELPGFTVYILAKKLILVLILIIILFIVIMNILNEKKIIKIKNKFLTNVNPVIISTYVIALFIFAAMCFYTVYINFKNHMKDNYTTNSNIFVMNLEKNDFSANVLALKHITKNIEEDIKQDSEEKAKEKLKKDYNSYIKKFLDTTEDVLNAFIILNDSTYTMIPDENGDYNIRYRKTWTTDEYFEENIYFIDSYNLGDISKGVLLSPIKHNDKEIGILSFNINSEEIEKSLVNYLASKDLQIYVFQYEKLYEINKKNLERNEVLRYDITNVDRRMKGGKISSTVKCNIDDYRGDYTFFHERLLNKTFIISSSRERVTFDELKMYIIILISIVIITLLFLYSYKIYVSRTYAKDIVRKITQKEKS